YQLAGHSVRLTRAGRIDDPKPIAPVLGHQPVHSTRALLHRHSAEFLFNVAGAANYVLGLVRRLAGYSRMPPKQKRDIRSQVINGLSVEIIRTLCAEVTEILLL